MNINKKIEEARAELYGLIEKYGSENLTNPVIIEKSQELDNLLNKLECCVLINPQHIKLIENLRRSSELVG